MKGISKKNVQKRVNARTKTQRKLRKQDFDFERKFQYKKKMNEMMEELGKVNLGETVEVLAAIWGHGGQCVIDKNKEENKPFFEVHKNVQTNVLGLGFSGVCSITSDLHNMQIDNALRVNPKLINSTNLTQNMIEATKGYIEYKAEEDYPMLLEKETDEERQLYSYIMDYGKEKRRCNKVYSPLQKGDNFVPNQEKNGKVLVRIYAIQPSDSSSTSFPIDLYFDSGISLNQIRDAIISKKEEIVQKLSPSRKFEKLVINLFDSTCNYTGEDAPNVAFTDTTKQRTMKGVVKTTAKEQNLIKKQKEKELVKKLQNDINIQRELAARITSPMDISVEASPASSSTKSNKSQKSASSTKSNKSQKSASDISL